MSSKEIFIMAIILLVSSPAWFLAEHTALAIIWLCAGVADLIIALVKRNKEKKVSKIQLVERLERSVSFEFSKLFNTFLN